MKKAFDLEKRALVYTLIVVVSIFLIFQYVLG